METEKERCEFVPNWLENDLSKSMTLSLPLNDDYRRIPLYPTLEDLTTTPSSLKINHVDYPYKNCDDYLDTFFRLMREDFISVIRDTLACIKNNFENGKLNNSDIWYYKNVKFETNQSSTIIYLRFDSYHNAQIIDYKNTDQFKNGALLLLSKDNFVTFSLGIVTDRFRLNCGIVGVDIVDFIEVNKWSNIDILEPKVFYEPYRYVMGVLQDMFETNFPMKNFIVYGLKNISFPRYLTKNSIYNINGIKFDILQDDQWPSAEILDMDKNQYEAFKGALTKEFTIIQGPPGTGKTYIGLQIVKVIIENMYITKKLTNPIMVVCMTNHALDQFLEGVSKITKQISRFGYGTKSKILVKYIPKISTSRSNKCTKIFVNALKDERISKNKVNLHTSNIKEVKCNRGILDLSCLKVVLTINGFNTFFQDSYDLLSWLFFDISNVNGLNPVDFIKRNQLLENWEIKRNNGLTNTLYCLTLEDTDIYFKEMYSKLTNLKKEEYDQGEYESEKQDLHLKMKIIRTIEIYLIEHLKLYKSQCFVEHHNQINHNLLKIEERWSLYYSWVYLFLIQEKNNIENISDTTRQYRRDINKFKSIGYLNKVKNKHLIGMTTTAAAKNRYLLKNLKCSIVIIEEAAEVLESHIVASLTEHCEHMILIGDHKQLRPQTANYLMSKNYQLDVSLFERMINNEIPSYVLAVQYRMRPEIAGLVAPAIYPNLRNHSSVMDRPHIRGVDKDVFFITHDVYEEMDHSLSSYINKSEATFILAMANYLINQGYQPEEIVIMATYNAQVLYISNLINLSHFEHLKDIRVSSVDGYQGEENEIVLLSLVRNNNDNNVGFLKIDNRVCVALSRARLGFYIIGNMDLLAGASNLWESVKNYLSSFNALGPKLLLKCKMHNTVLGSVSNNLDFNQLISCTLKCNVKLSCGHLCSKQCHNTDSDHLINICLNACKKKCSRGHQCTKMCYENCGRCEVSISIIGECNHIFNSICCDVTTIKCQQKENKILACGHTLEKKCFEPLICKNVCNKPNLNCPFRHLCKRQCGETCGLCIDTIFIIMNCGHISELQCSKTNKLKCLNCKECTRKEKYI